MKVPDQVALAEALLRRRQQIFWDALVIVQNSAAAIADESAGRIVELENEPIREQSFAQTEPSSELLEQFLREASLLAICVSWIDTQLKPQRRVYNPLSKLLRLLLDFLRRRRLWSLFCRLTRLPYQEPVLELQRCSPHGDALHGHGKIQDIAPGFAAEAVVDILGQTDMKGELAFRFSVNRTSTPQLIPCFS